jgi:elongation factor Ts
MSIDTQLITKLREITGAGVADCKVSLEEANNNLDQAVEILRKRGAIKAAKKAERATTEGVIAIARGEQKVAVVGLSCETDFVALNPDFVKAVNDLSRQLLDSTEADFVPAAETKIKEELIVKIGENLKLAFAQIVNGEILGIYLHANKKLASVVVLKSGSQSLANDLAMQVTAMSPKYLAPQDIPADVIAKEKEIYEQQLKTEGKPENMWEKIIPGKLNKFYQETCLLHQAFIKDDKISIGELVRKGQAEVVKFYRYQI